MAKMKKSPDWKQNELPTDRTFRDMDRIRREEAKKPKAAFEADEDMDGMKKGGRVKKYARGGGIESKGKTRGKTVKMARGGGVESRGKTRGKFV